MIDQTVDGGLKDFDNKLSRWLDRPIADLVRAATQNGMAYDKCSAGDVTIALAVCYVPKDENQRKSIETFVANTIGTVSPSPIEALSGVSFGDLLEANSMNAIAVHVHEPPYTVLVFTGNPTLAQKLSDRLLSNIESGEVDYYL